MSNQKTTWRKVMDLKENDNMHKGVANTLNKDDLNTILATADFFGASHQELQQIFFDLKVARYRLFDWLAMAIQGRLQNESAIKVFTHSFLKVDGNCKKFIEDLRVTDYQMVTDWEKIELTH